MPEDELLATAPPPADRRVRYGGEPEHFLDLYFAPDKPRAPLAMNIHGGYWRARYDLAHAAAFCAALAAGGVNVANLEYRRVDSLSQRPSWPRTFEDVRAAYRFLLQHAPSWDIPGSPSAVIGHSAGAQLAFCLAANEPSLGNCISLAGVLDLRRAWELHLSHDAVVDYLGGTPEQIPEIYREASPMELPITARQVVIHGLEDDVVPVSISHDYADAKRRSGERVEFIPLAGADHFDVVDPARDAFRLAAEMVLSVSQGRP